MLVVVVEGGGVVVVELPCKRTVSVSVSVLFGPVFKSLYVERRSNHNYMII